MIQVDITIIPHGTGKPKRRGRLKIGNDSTGTKYRGNYNVALFGARGNKPLRTGRIIGFHRRSEDVWELLKLALQVTDRKNLRL